MNLRVAFVAEPDRPLGVSDLARNDMVAGNDLRNFTARHALPAEMIIRTIRLWRRHDLRNFPDHWIWMTIITIRPAARAHLIEMMANLFRVLALPFVLRFLVHQVSALSLMRGTESR